MLDNEIEYLKNKLENIKENKLLEVFQEMELQAIEKVYETAYQAMQNYVEPGESDFTEWTMVDDARRARERE